MTTTHINRTPRRHAEEDSRWREEVRQHWMETGELPTEWTFPASDEAPGPITAMTERDLLDASRFFSKEPPRTIQNTWRPWIEALAAECKRRQLRGMLLAVHEDLLNQLDRAGVSTVTDPGRLSGVVTDALSRARELRAQARKLQEEADGFERTGITEAQALRALLARAGRPRSSA